MLSNNILESIPCSTVSLGFILNYLPNKCFTDQQAALKKF